MRTPGSNRSPNLEIENNDVRCSHASAVGPVDAEQRFYLESRGVPTGEAERLIVAGFLGEVLETLPVKAMREPLRSAIDAKLNRQRRSEGGRVVSVHVLFPLVELEAGTARKVTLEGHQISLVRIEDDVYAIGDVCSHEDVSLSEGLCRYRGVSARVLAPRGDVQPEDRRCRNPAGDPCSAGV